MSLSGRPNGLRMIWGFDCFWRANSRWWVCAAGRMGCGWFGGLFAHDKLAQAFPLLRLIVFARRSVANTAFANRPFSLRWLFVVLCYIYPRICFPILGRFANAQNVSTHPKRRHDRQQTNRKRKYKCQRFAKLKEVFCQRTCQHKNTTFNFAQPHPKSTHHGDYWTIIDNFISYNMRC